MCDGTCARYPVLCTRATGTTVCTVPATVYAACMRLARTACTERALYSIMHYALNLEFARIKSSRRLRTFTVYVISCMIVARRFKQTLYKKERPAQCSLCSAFCNRKRFEVLCLTLPSPRSCILIRKRSLGRFQITPLLCSFDNYYYISHEWTH